MLACGYVPEDKGAANRFYVRLILTRSVIEIYHVPRLHCRVWKTGIAVNV
jgi:hypothetical protein